MKRLTESSIFLQICQKKKNVCGYTTLKNYLWYSNSKYILLNLRIVVYQLRKFSKVLVNCRCSSTRTTQLPVAKYTSGKWIAEIYITIVLYYDITMLYNIRKILIHKPIFFKKRTDHSKLFALYNKIWGILFSIFMP